MREIMNRGPAAAETLRQKVEVLRRLFAGN